MNVEPGNIPDHYIFMTTVFEFKAYGEQSQFNAVDEAVRTARFIRNSCLRYWIDNKKVGRYDLNGSSVLSVLKY